MKRNEKLAIIIALLVLITMILSSCTKEDDSLSELIDIYEQEQTDSTTVPPTDIIYEFNMD